MNIKNITRYYTVKSLIHFILGGTLNFTMPLCQSYCYLAVQYHLANRPNLFLSSLY